ncbi:MAG: hypothetical protein ABL857_08675 [Rickettsiales bacterium]
MNSNQYWEGKARDFIIRDIWKDDDDYRTYLNNELLKIDEADHKSIFLNTALKQLDIEHTKHLETCSNPGNTSRCLDCNHYPKIKYITEQAYKKINPVLSYSQVTTRVDAMEKIGQTEYEFLLRLFKTGNLSFGYELLKSSEIYIRRDKKQISGIYVPVVTFIMKVDPEAYIKSYERGALDLNELAKIVAGEYQKFSDVKFNATEAKPELNKFQILPNAIKPILTGWDEINKGQDELIEQLSDAETEVEYQNVGNTSRTLLQKLAAIVFDPQKHVAPDYQDPISKEMRKVKLEEGNFKNRFHTYIKTELNSKQDDELRGYINSMIETTERAADLSNKTTHDLKAYKLMAESCVIGVITVIKLIKLVHEHNLS